MRYHSTNQKTIGLSFREALMKGLAEDGGLFIPDSIPLIPAEELKNFSDMSYPEIAASVISRYFDEGPEHDEFLSICRDAYNFKVPVELLSENEYILRLDQGPTASFKDFGARMMARLMQWYLSRKGDEFTILTATSGDTGSAVASAFAGIRNIKVVILFPEKEVSPIQRKQMTTLNGNITVVAVDGKFDDCQHLVKRAFMDKDLSSCRLTSANSINIGRLIPQSVYYAYVWSRLIEKTKGSLFFSVPSGNFGNLMGGLLAREMGLKNCGFIVAANSNDEVPRYLATGQYEAVIPSRNCISSAMNVGHPSNLPRIISLYKGIMDEKGRIIREPDIDKMRADLSAWSISDEDTKAAMKHVYKNYGVVLEPHGAVAWKGTQLHKMASGNPDNTYVSLSTAHPAKFASEVEEVCGILPALPPSLAGLETKEERLLYIDNDYFSLTEIIKKV